MMPKQFENGVQWYTRGYVQIVFPEKDVCCKRCPCVRSVAGGVQHQCCLNGAVLYNLDNRGEHCPILTMAEDEHE